jgi:SAM-dependent methyltransferase
MSGTTWHYGLVARWWAEFSEPGPEIDYFRRLVEDGQPALDVACGTGRLLLPYLRAGLDVDGCDVSPDMLAECTAAAEREGLSPRLYAQAMHELDLPRRYRTIFVCGGFGLGSTREQDAEAMRRFHAHLEPEGLLALDAELPPEELDEPHEWREPRRRRRGSDGADYALVGRLVDFDGRRATRELRAFMWRDGELVAQEQHSLTEQFYDPDELVSLLEGAGFADVEVRTRAEDGFLVYLARRVDSAGS